MKEQERDTKKIEDIKSLPLQEKVKKHEEKLKGGEKVEKINKKKAD